MHIIGFVKLLSTNDVYFILSLIINDSKLVYFKFEQPANIDSILFTFEKSKFDKSNVVNKEQSLNISLIHSTFGVLKFDIFKVVNDEHP